MLTENLINAGFKEPKEIYQAVLTGDKVFDRRGNLVYFSDTEGWRLGLVIVGRGVTLNVPFTHVDHTHYKQFLKEK